MSRAAVTLVHESFGSILVENVPLQLCSIGGVKPRVVIHSKHLLKPMQGEVIQVGSAGM